VLAGDPANCGNWSRREAQVLVYNSFSSKKKEYGLNARKTLVSLALLSLSSAAALASPTAITIW
jgi:hypothetical protein